MTFMQILNRMSRIHCCNTGPHTDANGGGRLPLGVSVQALKCVRWRSRRETRQRPLLHPPTHPVTLTKVYPHYTTGLAGNTPRQLTPVTYSQNSCIDVVRASELMRPEGPSMTGERVYGLVTEAMLDIDTEEDFKDALAKVSG